MPREAYTRRMEKRRRIEFEDELLSRGIYVYRFAKSTKESHIESWFEGYAVDEIIWIDGQSCIVFLEDGRMVSSFLEEKNSASASFKRFDSNQFSSHKLKGILEKIRRKCKERALKKEITFEPTPQEVETWTAAIERCDNLLGRETVNPPLIFEKIEYEKLFFYVFREDNLRAGTKQRGLIPLVLHDSANEFVYAGPVYGYAQVALSYSTSLCQKKSTLFLEKRQDLHPLSRLAASFGASIHQIEGGTLRKVQEAAENYTRKKNAEENKFVPFHPSSSHHHFSSFQAARSFFLLD